MTQPTILVFRSEFLAQQGEEGRPVVSREQAGSAGSTATPNSEGGPGQMPSQQEQCMSTLPWLLGMLAIFYFLLIRPQQKQEKTRRAMLGALKEGDKIVTTGGIHGTISSLSETTAVVRIDAKIKITIDRANIARAGGEGQPES